MRICNAILVLFVCGNLQAQTLPSGKTDNKKADKLYHEAFQDFKNLQFENSLSKLKKALQKDKDFVDALDLMGRIYSDNKEFKKSISIYRKIKEINPQYWLADYELSTLYFSIENYDSSIHFGQLFLQFKNLPSQMEGKIKSTIQNGHFAKKAKQNPVKFQPINLGSQINSGQEEYFPNISVDGAKIYFTRRDSKLPPYQQNEDIYFCEINEGRLSKWQSIGPPINTNYNEGAFGVSADGQYIFYTSNRPNGFGRFDIWLSEKTENGWAKPFNLGPSINSKHWDAQPTVNPKGDILFFVSNRPGGFGGSDIYYSQFVDDKGWLPAQNAGPQINTFMDEQFPFVHPDGQTLYFSSQGWPGMGKSDLFKTNFSSELKFTKAENLGYPINTSASEWSLVVDRNGKTAYYATNRGPNAMGGMDIYRFDLPKEAQAEKVSFVRGIVRSKTSKQALEARVQLIDLATGKIEREMKTDSIKGSFFVTLTAGKSYLFNVSKPGYLFYSENFDLLHSLSSKPKELIANLEKIKIGGRTILRNVFFETGKYDLRKESETELSKLYLLLLENPKIRIEIGGHTDNVGKKEDNILLSQNRAKAVSVFLQQKGIKTHRILTKGYGEEQPIDTNETEEGRAKNRRTEFTIIK